MPVDSVTYPGGRSFNRRNYDPVTNPDGMANGGTDVNWFDMCQAHIDVGAAAVDAAATAQSARDEAAAFALTSTTSVAALTIGAGAKTLTMNDPLPLIPGTWATVASQTSSANFMVGLVSARDGLVLTIVVPAGLTAAIGGAGTFSAWRVQASGAPGANGGQGATGSPGIATLADARGQMLLANLSRIQSYLP